MLLLYAADSMLNLCRSEGAGNPDAISEAHFEACFLSVLKDDSENGEFQVRSPKDRVFAVDFV